MPTIKTFNDWIKNLATIFLIFLSVLAIIKISGWGVVRMVTPTIADSIYNVVDTIIMGIAYLFLIALVLIAVYITIIYFKNRGKAQPETEVEKLIKRIDRLITILEGK